MIAITINKVLFTIAENIGELTTYQYCELNKHRNDLNIIRMLSILTGIDYSVLNNADCSQFEPILSLVKFDANENQLSELQVGETVTINDKVCNINQDLGTETFGQKVFAQQVVTNLVEEKIDKIEAIIKVAAIYLQPQYDGKEFDDKRANELDQVLQDLPITHVYPVGNFFLSKYVRLLKENPKP